MTRIRGRPGAGGLGLPARVSVASARRDTGPTSQDLDDTLSAQSQVLCRGCLLAVSIRGGRGRGGLFWGGHPEAELMPAQGHFASGPRG